MVMQIHLRWLFIFLVWLASADTFAQVKADVAGSSDVSFIGRFPGSFISAYTTSEYDEYLYPKTLNSYEKPKDFSFESLSGERKVIIYDVPNEDNVLKIFKSLEQGFAKAGFKSDISCNGRNSGCGYNFLREVTSQLEFDTYFRYKFRDYSILSSGRLHIYSGSLQKGKDTYYLVAVVAQSRYAHFPQYSFDLLKVSSLSTESLVLNENQMQSDMSANGRVVLTGLYFENNSASLLGASADSLEVIASYLKSNKDKKFLVVGHTDSKGGYSYNKGLSSDRASSVKKALVDQYGILPKSLKAVGVAFAAPQESNQNSEGRQKNRRVELVEVEQF